MDSWSPDFSISVDDADADDFYSSLYQCGLGVLPDLDATSSLGSTSTTCNNQQQQQQHRQCHNEVGHCARSQRDDEGPEALVPSSTVPLPVQLVDDLDAVEIDRQSVAMLLRIPDSSPPHQIQPLPPTGELHDLQRSITSEHQPEEPIEASTSSFCSAAPTYVVLLTQGPSSDAGGCGFVLGCVPDVHQAFQMSSTLIGVERHHQFAGGDEMVAVVERRQLTSVSGESSSSSGGDDVRHRTTSTGSEQTGSEQLTSANGDHQDDADRLCDDVLSLLDDAGMIDIYAGNPKSTDDDLERVDDDYMAELIGLESQLESVGSASEGQDKDERIGTKSSKRSKHSRRSGNIRKQRGPADLAEKLERRREQNRRAARGSRERKKEHSQSVIKEYQRQHSLQTALNYEIGLLKQEQTNLLKLLVDHLGQCSSASATAAAAAAATVSTATDAGDADAAETNVNSCIIRGDDLV